MKWLKNPIKEWNKDSYGNIDLIIQQIDNEVKQLEIVTESRAFT